MIDIERELPRSHMLKSVECGFGLQDFQVERIQESIEATASALSRRA